MDACPKKKENTLILTLRGHSNADRGSNKTKLLKEEGCQIKAHVKTVDQML